MSTKLRSLSIVLPCHNEEEVIEQSWRELDAILKPLLKNIISDYELVMVNNGSTDNTIGKMLKLQEIDKKIKIVDLRNNFGYQGSITAGLYNAENDMIITLDADLQEDPNKIPHMIKKHYEGYDLVLGVRNDRKADGFLKRYTANIFYKLSNSLGLNTIPHHSDFRLLSKDLLEDFKKYEEKNKYIRGIVPQLDSKYVTVEYTRRKREAGKTKFKIAKLFSLAIEGITSFSVVPIRLIFLFGLSVFSLSLISMFYFLYMKFVANVRIEEWIFLALTISLIGSLNSLFIGVIGEYIGKNYLETKNRPMFTIRKIYKK